MDRSEPSFNQFEVMDMRTSLLAGAVLGSLFAAQAATAQTTVIERRGADVVVDSPATTSTTRVERRESSDGCATKSVTKTNDMGDRKTVTKESCD